MPCRCDFLPLFSNSAFTIHVFFIGTHVPLNHCPCSSSPGGELDLHRVASFHFRKQDGALHLGDTQAGLFSSLCVLYLGKQTFH